MSIGIMRTRILYVMPAEKITVFVANAVSRYLGQFVEVDIVDSNHLLSSFLKKEPYDAVLLLLIVSPASTVGYKHVNVFSDRDVAHPLGRDFRHTQVVGDAVEGARFM